MRLHQPSGYWLLFWPCAIAITMASFRGGTKFDEYGILLLLFFIGSIVMRAAGCIINDIFDRKIDAKVARTKDRPLANGELTLKTALLVLTSCLLIGLIVLTQLPMPAIIAALLFCIPVVIYPLTKRFFPYPQLFLGLTFNAGAIVGWLAIAEKPTTAMWLLYAGCMLWTLAYDTIYALQDVEDDAKLGLNSTARSVGTKAKSWVTFWIVSYVLLLQLALIETISGQTLSGEISFSILWPYLRYFWPFLLLCCFLLALSLRKLYRLNIADPRACMAWFRANAWWGALPVLGMLLSILTMLHAM